MSGIIAFIIAILSIASAIERPANYHRYRQRPRGQMGFKWTRRQYTRGNGMRYSAPSTTDNVETETTAFEATEPVIYEPDIPEPTLNPDVDGEENIPPPPQVVMDNDYNTIEPDNTFEPLPTEFDDGIFTESTDIPFAFDTTDNEQEQEQEGQENIHQPPIMDCLYSKCPDTFNQCFNDEQCKEFMREWQQRQSLNLQCLPSTNNDDEGNDISNENEPFLNTEEAEETSVDCPYNAAFWNMYNCGVENYCYNDQLVLAASHKYLLSPSNFRVSPTNVTGSKSSSFDFTLIMVAITSGICGIILVEVIRRLYNVMKDQCECNSCECAEFKHGLRYLRNKWEQIRGYKYQKTHGDITAIEEEEDDAMYGDEASHDHTMGVTYNGAIDDSDCSDDEELQKCRSSKPISLREQTEDDEESGDIQTDNDDLIATQELSVKSMVDEEQKDEEVEREQVSQEPMQPL